MSQKRWIVLAALAAVSLVLPARLAAASHGKTALSAPHRRVLALPCRATAVTATLSWQATNGALTGRLTYMNHSATACTLAGRPTILLLANGTQVLPVVITLPVATVTHFALGNIVPVTVASGRNVDLLSIAYAFWAISYP